VRVEIDRGMCMGAGECVFIAPQVFQLDGDHRSAVVQFTEADEQAVRDASAAFPNFAVVVHE
jgi:ferredoxin